MILDAQGVTHVNFEAFVDLEVRDLTQAGELRLHGMPLSIFHRQILLVKFLGDAPKLVQKGLDCNDLLLLNIGALQDLVSRTKAVCEGLGTGARYLARSSFLFATFAIFFGVLLL